MTSEINQRSHRPFVIRKTIVLSAAALGILGGCVSGNIALGIVLYFCFVTLFDGISYFLFHLKPSDFLDPERLLKSEKVTPEEFDRYFDTRRCIRFASLVVAGASFGGAFFFSPYALEVFCLSYVLATILGIFYVRFFVKIPRPRLIYRDDRYYVPHRIPIPGTMTEEQYLLALGGCTPFSQREY